MKQDFNGVFRLLYDEFGDAGVEFVKNQGAQFVRERVAARLVAPSPRGAGAADDVRESPSGVESDVHRAARVPDADARPGVESTEEAESAHAERAGDAVDYSDAEGFSAAMEGRVDRLAAHAVMSPADVVSVVQDIVLMAGEVRKFEEVQVTQRLGIAAERDVAIANIRAQREVLQDYLARSFDERADNFQRLFDVVDTALDTNNMQALAMGLDSVVKLAASSPFKDLRSVEETAAALTDPDHEWDF